MVSSKIGARMKDAARLAGLTDAEVARRLDMSSERYCNYARDVREPDFETLLRIASTLSVTPNWLFGIPEPQMNYGFCETDPQPWRHAPPDPPPPAVDETLLRAAIVGALAAMRQAQVSLPHDEVARIVLAAYRTYAPSAATLSGRDPASLPDAIAALISAASH